VVDGKGRGGTYKPLKKINLSASADQLECFAKSYIDVKQAQDTEGTTEIRVIPQILNLKFMAWEKTGEMVQCP
jgi:hypothetical protein